MMHATEIQRHEQRRRRADGIGLGDLDLVEGQGLPTAGGDSVMQRYVTS
jgi:hypothetical protein